MDGRRMDCPRGKVIGGSSSINGMVYIRGNPLDYDEWARIPGLEHWAYSHCLPYFRRAETRDTGPNDYHGGDGPLPVTQSTPSNPLFAAFIESGVAAGFERTDDLNGYRQEGFAPMDRTTWRGRRGGAAFFYLKPALSRPNLALRMRTLITRVTIEEGRATGIELAGAGGVERIHADREVICCAGAIDSPRILQRSGVGDPDFLASLGIAVAADRPGSAPISRTIPRSTSSTARSFRSRSIRPSSPGISSRSARAGSSPAPDRGIESLRGGRVRALARRSEDSEPAISLRADRDELRRAQPRRRARISDARGADEGHQHRARADPLERPARSPVPRLQLPHHGVRSPGHARRGPPLARDCRAGPVRSLPRRGDWPRPRRPRP